MHSKHNVTYIQLGIKIATTGFYSDRGWFTIMTGLIAFLKFCWLLRQPCSYSFPFQLVLFGYVHPQS